MIENITNATSIPPAAGAIFGSFVLFFIILWIFFFIIGILGTILWIFMLIDAIKRNYKNENDRLVWILIIILANVIGAIVYYFVIKSKDKNIK